MKNKIEQIILKAIGEDSIEIEGFPNLANMPRRQLRAKAPEIAQEILDSVVGEIEKVSEFADSGDTLKQRIINHLTK
jgi:hypothetical protein